MPLSSLTTTVGISSECDLPSSAPWWLVSSRVKPPISPHGSRDFCICQWWYMMRHCHVWYPPEEDVSTVWYGRGSSPSQPAAARALAVVATGAALAGVSGAVLLVVAGKLMAVAVEAAAAVSAFSCASVRRALRSSAAASEMPLTGSAALLAALRCQNKKSEAHPSRSVAPSSVRACDIDFSSLCTSDTCIKFLQPRNTACSASR